jgi:hypothetical protein
MRTLAHTSKLSGEQKLFANLEGAGKILKRSGPLTNPQP